MPNSDRVPGPFRKSTHSGAGSSDCVEVGNTGRSVMVRDSKLREGSAIPFPPGAWREFTRAIRSS
jgi:uncharacterized protein DUF397